MRERANSLPLVLALACALALAACGAAGREQGGSLLVEARVVVDDEARPVSSATLYLLDADPIRLAMNEPDARDEVQSKTHREHPRLRVLAGLMNGRRFSAYPLGPDIALMLEQSRPLWETHVVREARTDERGRARFERLAPGHYWLTCLAERDGKLAFWAPRVTVERGPGQEVLLDLSNALTYSDKPAKNL